MIITTKHGFLKLAAAMMSCAVLAACYSPPFQQPELTPVRGIEPGKAASRFAEKLPDKFETENTIIFRFFRNEIAALGYARVNRKERTFDIVCINHMGVQLFHISGDDSGNHLIHAMPEFKKHPGFTDAVGNDIRNIYFDLTPGESARASVRRNHIKFRQPGDDKTIEYVFGGAENSLLKKRARTRWRTKWEAAFYEYFTVSDNASDYLFPRGIVLHNRRYRYRLIIRTRSVNIPGKTSENSQ